MFGIEVELKGKKEMVVEPQDLASVLENVGAEVLSTDRVVLLMELAARKAIEDRLPEGMMTVGTFIRIKHLAASPLGVKVRGEAHLKKINGSELVFEVAAYDEFERISEGENEQLIGSVEKFLSRIQKKKSPSFSQ
jgi:predicted thioesterase